MIGVFQNLTQFEGAFTAKTCTKYITIHEKNNPTNLSCRLICMDVVWYFVLTNTLIKWLRHAYQYTTWFAIIITKSLRKIKRSIGMPVLASLMNALFWERRDFHVSFSGRDSQGTFEIVPQEVLWSIWGSCQTLWSPSLPNNKWHLYSDVLHWSDISQNRDLVTELDRITVFDVIT